MPVTIKIPVPRKNPPFGFKPKLRGLGAFFARVQTPPLPAGSSPFLQRAGMGAFFVPAPCPVLPAASPFPQFVRRSPAGGCSSCAHKCSRRGMGDDLGDALQTSSSSTALIPPVDFSTDLQSSPLSDLIPVTAPPAYQLSPSSTTDLSTLTDSNPSLTAFNQGLTNSLVNRTYSPAQLKTLNQFAGYCKPVTTFGRYRSAAKRRCAAYFGVKHFERIIGVKHFERINSVVWRANQQLNADFWRAS